MGNIAKRSDGAWRARYRDANGREHSKHFGRKGDAQRWLDQAQAATLTGQYVDPRAGRITLREYAEEWKLRQVHRATTVDQVEGILRRHILPHLGNRRLSAILPSDIQRWVRHLSQRLAPSSVGVAHRILSGIFKSAVADRRIVSNPCTGTKLPKVAKRKVQPISATQLQGIVEQMPERHRALVVMAAGTGLRQASCSD